MGRDTRTSDVAKKFTEDWKKSGKTPHEFVRELEANGKVFDCQYNGGFDESECNGDYGSKYVVCHNIVNGRIVSIYYIHSRNEFFAKY